jgi:hypothetical protein
MSISLDTRSFDSFDSFARTSIAHSNAQWYEFNDASVRPLRDDVMTPEVLIRPIDLVSI